MSYVTLVPGPYQESVTMGKDSIRLSPKHGVNPSLAVCYYCGEDQGDIILPGKLPNDAEAPRRAVWHKVPCDKCKELMAKGVMVVRVDEEKRPSRGEPYRTGELVVVKDEAVARIFSAEFAQTALASRFVFCPAEIFDQLFGEGIVQPDNNEEE